MPESFHAAVTARPVLHRAHLREGPVSASNVALICEAPPLARLLEIALVRMGLAPRRVPPTAATLDTLHAAPPSLLVLMLLGRDPCTQAICQAVGQDPAFAATRLVIVQDSARDIDLRRAHALGADEVLSLPLDPAKLGAAVRSLLSIPA